MQPDQANREKKTSSIYDLVPVSLIEATARVFEYGAVKYAARNWEKGLMVPQVCSSMIRHLFALMRGERTDPESGLSHIDHICANAAFLAEYEERAKSDGRYAALFETR